VPAAKSVAPCMAGRVDERELMSMRKLANERINLLVFEKTLFRITCHPI